MNMKMLTIMEEVKTNTKKGEIFFCIFLNDGQCLSEKRPCPKDRNDKKCQEIEDAFA